MKPNSRKEGVEGLRGKAVPPLKLLWCQASAVRSPTKECFLDVWAFWPTFWFRVQRKSENQHLMVKFGPLSLQLAKVGAPLLLLRLLITAALLRFIRGHL